MPLKVVFEQEIHICNSQLASFQALLTFIQSSFKKLPQSIVLYYQDQDGDHITLSCDEDLKAMIESCKNAKVFIEASSKETNILSQSDLSKSQILFDQDEIKFMQQQNQLNSFFEEKTVLPNDLVCSLIAKSWYCPLCTYLNHEIDQKCQVCETEKQVIIEVKKEQKQEQQQQQQIYQDYIQEQEKKQETPKQKDSQTVQKVETQTKNNEEKQTKIETSSQQTPESDVIKNQNTKQVIVTELWVCPDCTFDNQIKTIFCTMCGRCKPIDPQKNFNQEQEKKPENLKIAVQDLGKTAIIGDKVKVEKKEKKEKKKIEKQEKPKKAEKKEVQKPVPEKKKQQIRQIVNEELQNQLGNLTQQVANLLKQQDQQQQQKQYSQIFQFIEPIQEKPVHKGYVCDKCDIAPIVGIRYKCVVCPDFDYCEKCESTTEHIHPFLKIRKPEQAPIAIFASIDDNISQMVQQVESEYPEMQPIFQKHQQENQVQKHVFEELLEQEVKQLNEQKKSQEEKKKKDAKKKNKLKKMQKLKEEIKKQILQEDQKEQVQEQQQQQQKESKTQQQVQQEKKEIVEEVKQEVTQEQEKENEFIQVNYSWTVQNQAKLMTEYMGGEQKEYLEICHQHSKLSLDEIANKYVDQLKIKSVIVPKVEQPVIQVQSKQYSQQTIDKCNIIAQVLGGSASDYYESVDVMNSSQVEDIILHLLDEKQMFNQKN